jgi:hypothetical protein
MLHAAAGNWETRTFRASVHEQITLVCTVVLFQALERECLMDFLRPRVLVSCRLEDISNCGLYAVMHVCVCVCVKGGRW